MKMLKSSAVLNSIKVSVSLPESQLNFVDRIASRRANGRRGNKSAIIQEAVEMLMRREGALK